jgi:hypothetical protein
MKNIEMRMRTLINIAIISTVFLGTNVFAANISPNNRARPGSVKGFIITNQTQQVKTITEQGPYTTPGLDIHNCPGCRPAPHITGIPNSECGEILPTLGVDICIARKACSGIQINGHSGIFDETTTTCKIPVCAYNWSGIIKKDTEDVCTYVDMNKVITCNADLFEQIDSMRRTSQWVVPLAVAGGAGIGTGVGALIDNKQNKKAENLALIADEVGAKFDKTITFAGKNYKLPEDADELKVAIKANHDLKAKINKVNTLIDECTKNMFVELTSNTVNGKPKWGRIKLTNGSDCASSDHDVNKVKYCQFQNPHSGTNSKADCAKNLYKETPFNDDYLKSVNSTNPISSYFNSWGNWGRDATCYFRDSLGSGEANVHATIQSDLATIEFLKNYIQTFSNDPDRQILVNLLKKFKFESNFSTSGASNVNKDILNWVIVKSEDNTKFNIISGGSCNTRELDNILNINNTNSMSSGASSNILFEAFGALSVLKSIGVSLSDDLNTLLNTLILSDEILEIKGLGDSIRSELGADRPFFKTAKGRGLLIGSGVGAVAGLGYWFAEGAGTFCDVGGLEQVKLKKSYSIPSFRDYLINKGFIK